MKQRLAALMATASLVGSMWVAPALAEELTVETTPADATPMQTHQQSQLR